MLSIQLSFEGKKVKIIGGGKQAWRKGKMFLAENADVLFYADHFIDEIPEALRVYMLYEKDILQDAFLIYACSNDASLNHRIIEDANARHILCASIHLDETATVHMLRTYDAPYLHVALSTKGASPSYGERIIKDMDHMYWHKEHEILHGLSMIRSHVKRVCDDQQKRSSFLKWCSAQDRKWIHFLALAIQYRFADILCLHGNQRCKDDLIDFLQLYDQPAWFAFYKPKDHELSLLNMKDLMHFLKIDAHYHIITLTKGYAAAQMALQLSKETLYLDTFDQEDVRNMISHYKGEEVLFVLHDEKNRQLFHMLKECLENHMHVICLHDELPEIHSEKAITIVPVFLLKGKHYEEDIAKTLLKKAQSKYGNVNLEKKVLIEQDFYRKRLREKMKKMNC